MAKARPGAVRRAKAGGPEAAAKPILAASLAVKASTIGNVASSGSILPNGGAVGVDEPGDRGSDQDPGLAKPFLQRRRREKHHGHGRGQSERGLDAKGASRFALGRLLGLQSAGGEHGAVARRRATPGDQARASAPSVAPLTAARTTAI